MGTKLQPASQDTYETKYQLKKQDGTLVDKDLDETFQRVAKALASVEADCGAFLDKPPIDNLSANQSSWYYKFLYALQNGAIPAGRILSNAGAEELKPNTSLINCTVSGNISDDISGIGQAVKEAMETLAKGCGIGYCFSSLRPKGALVGGVGATTSGSLSFMNIFDSACFTISSAGGRRGAEMATMHVWHPDIIDFIKAKREDGRFRQFNLSVLLTDDFMKAAQDDADWQLYFPLHKKEADYSINSKWVDNFPFKSPDYITGISEPTVPDSAVLCKVYQVIKARELWDLLVMKSTFEFSEPGVLFIDRINESNPLNSVETINATNPCLHPDSLIETIHGRVRIADITEPTMVYTMLEDGSLGIKKASASFVSAEQVKTLRITTRNGKVLRVTPNHLVKVHGGIKIGVWKRADELKIGDTIIQLCRARRGAAYSGVKLTSEDNRAYRMEHVMIADAVYGVLADEDVHHIDGNTYNNCVDNLEVMSHGSHARHTALNDNPQTHQRYCEHTGQFLASFEKKKKTIVPMPEELRSNMKNASSSAILSIEQDEELVDVYDLTVEDTHNFIADFCVVHNCGR